VDDTADRNEKAAVLRALHRRGQPLILPNAWDAASARLFVAAGFPAVATSSGAVAAALGYGDGQQMPVAEMLAAVARIARAVSVPVSADIEAGYGLEAGMLVDRLLAAGAAGCNLEDSDPRSHELVPVDEQAQRLTAVRAAAGPALVINARIDVFLRKAGGMDDAVHRAERYLAAGADCVFPIFAPAEAIGPLAARIPGPMNVLYHPGMPGFARLAALGVARVSFGSGLQRAAHAAVERLAARLQAGEDPFAKLEGVEDQS
jgi:2-methylisocitrate lyase-like PEP mutase family enzyme